MKDTLEGLEEFAVEVIYGRRRDLAASTLRVLLRGLSALWRAGVSLRHALYRHRLLHSRHLGCFVISIGNLTVGGTGKTPVVEMLARSLIQRGRRVAVLSRGYKSEKPPADPVARRRLPGRRRLAPPRIVSNGSQVLLESRYAGDEPFMLASNLHGVPVLVDIDRVHAGAFAVREFGSDTLLLDDGLQYIRLGRRLNVVLVDSTEPFGTGRLLPGGTLREPPSGLRRAHYIFLTKCDGHPQDQLVDRIRRYNRTAGIIQCTHSPRYLQNVATGERLPLGALDDAYIGVMCGIASPRSLVTSLTQLGANVALRRYFNDHHRYRRREVQHFSELCIDRDLSMIVTTEKDAVRLPNLREHEVPIYFLRVEIEILSGDDVWERCISRICHPVLPRRLALDPI
ncbi:MAG TPA: tetraacyldisaccharide 4'-kinase [Verrucomicrobiales bacterium]|nr:tetraacyldisaccharide 4'-kinase [Verrucomicrobiales bacterium]